MNYDFAMKWADALESGKYKQTRSALFNGEGYCCLGVLCEISSLHSFVKKDDNMIHLNNIAIPYTTYIYENAAVSLPQCVMRLTGIKTDVAVYDKSGNCLSSDNDSGKTFEQIAQIIREKWEVI